MLYRVDPRRLAGSVKRSPSARRYWAAVRAAAGPSLVLGVLTALLLRVIAQLPVASANAVDADPFGRVTWSLIVCLSLGAGTAIGRRRIPALATAGLIGAPFAFIVARSVRRASVELLKVMETGAGPSPWVLAAIKGIEYAFLGAAVGWLGRRNETRPPAYLAAGLISGLAFGGANLAVTVALAPTTVSFPTILAWGVNEIIFPAGCALVVWNIHRMARERLKTEAI